MNGDCQKLVVDRQINLDYLRVLATLAVIILHIASANWHITDVNGLAWQSFNFYDSAVRWCVPIFVMISGALFLPKEISLKKLYSKYIFRMFTAFMTWSLFYSVIDYINGKTFTSVIKGFVQGHYHMWFLLMITGIYICIPLIKTLVSETIYIKYYLIVSFVFAFLFPQIICLLKDFSSGPMIKIANIVNRNITYMNMNFVMGYVFYFVLGYYINSIKLSKKQRLCIYCLGIIGFCFTVIFDSIIAIKTQKACDNYYGNFMVNILLESLAVFVFFKYVDFKKQKMNVIIIKLSKFSFGAYLIHALVIEQSSKYGINSMMCNPLVAVPITAIIVFTISFIISFICNNIPILKKYIV